MGDILKEAIADAKAVRETALANAKMALEEAFTPQLKSMLSAKLREEDDEFEGEEEAAEDEIGDEEEAEEAFEEDEEFGGDDADEEESFEDDEEESFDDEEVAETIEVNGKTYSLVAEDDEEEGEDIEDYGDDEEVEEELDLEAIIKELENELSEDESSDEDFEDGEEEAEGEEVNEDEEFEIDETLFFEEDGDDEEDEEEVEESTEISAVQSELDEYKEAVVFLKDKLHEVNILNAKLLFTNKLFKEFSLDNGQKLKVVETFDRAQTTREIKLVYSTLAEQFGDNGSITRKTKNINESASKPVSSTKPSKESKKVITEEEQVANRMRKLAGLL